MQDNDNRRHLDEAILERDDLGVSRATGILSVLFRKTLCDIGVNASTWNKLMLNYLTDRRNRIPNNSRARSSTRGNLNKELSKSNMTWNNFQKAIRFLNPVKAVFCVKLTWLSGKTTVHEVSLNGDDKEVYTVNPKQIELLDFVLKNPGTIIHDFNDLMVAAYLEQEGYLISFVSMDCQHVQYKHWGLSNRGLSAIFSQ